MYCHNCGNLLREGAQYCTKCGTKIREQKVHSRKNYMMIGIVLVVLVASLAGIVAAVYQYNKNNIIGKWTAYSLINAETGEERTFNSLIENEWKDNNETNYTFEFEFLDNQTYKIQSGDENGEGTWEKQADGEEIILFVSDDEGEKREIGSGRIVDGYFELTEDGVPERIWKFERE